MNEPNDFARTSTFRHVLHVERTMKGTLTSYVPNLVYAGMVSGTRRLASIAVLSNNHEDREDPVSQFHTLTDFPFTEDMYSR